MIAVQIDINGLLVQIDIISERTYFIFGILFEDDRTYVMPYFLYNVEIPIGIIYTTLGEQIEQNVRFRPLPRIPPCYPHPKSS